METKTFAATDGLFIKEKLRTQIIPLHFGELQATYLFSFHGRMEKTWTAKSEQVLNLQVLEPTFSSMMEHKAICMSTSMPVSGLLGWLPNNDYIAGQLERPAGQGLETALWNLGRYIRSRHNMSIYRL